MKNVIDIISKLTHMMGQMEETAKEQFNLAGLTYTQLHYMEALSMLGNPNITELAIYLKLTKPTVKVAIDKFIERDYVFKVLSDEDRRSSHLHLTEKGKLINQMHEYAHKRIAESIGRKLSKEELVIFVGLLNKVLSEE